MSHKKQLLDLPDELLGAVLRQLSDGKTRLQIFRTSKRLATVLLQHMPVIQLTYPLVYRENADDIKPIAPFMTKALHDRHDPPLHLRLHPERKLFKAIKAVAAGNRLTARSLSALELCPAVTSLTLRFTESFTFSWEPVFSAALAASFPSLTHLILKDVTLSATQLRQVISHPLLLPRLRGLGLIDAKITDAARLAASPFTGGKLQQLYLRRDTGWDFTPHLAPLAPHLTQLAVLYDATPQFESLAAAVSLMTCLQWLELSTGMEFDPGQGFSAMLPVLAHLPSLSTLVMPHERVVGQDQLDALLALTLITYLDVKSFCNLTESRATADCSWQQLVLEHTCWSSMQLLPLHSLTLPLRVDVIHGSFRTGGAVADVVAAAELNMFDRNKAGLVVKDMLLNRAAIDLLTELYLSHSRRTAQQFCHPTVPSSSHSGPSTSLASSSSPEGHVTPGGQCSSIEQGGQQGATVGRQVLMQRLGPSVKRVLVEAMGLSHAHLSSANMRALTALFPSAGVKFV
ncbi:hypothetical protein QJQ45_011010 [Haematococcus lacustris]|nr:hypothetical protein QJQ45_011010 [Haematococcus lacustris]